MAAAAGEVPAGKCKTVTVRTEDAQFGIQKPAFTGSSAEGVGAAKRTVNTCGKEAVVEPMRFEQRKSAG